jgi:hypothetical protein
VKVYLAGPMSGYPGFNYPAFDAAAKHLRAQGYDVVSPAELDGPVDREVILAAQHGTHDELPADADYESYIDRALDVIRDGDFDYIVCLPGWDRSSGAIREVALAQSIGVMRADYVPPGSFSQAFAAYDENPLRQRAVTGAVKDNKDKSRLDLLASKPLLAIGRVLGFGAKKYKPNNWRLGLSWSDTTASALRHVFAFADGEDIDPESGECHIDCALTQLMFLSEYYHTGTGADDRWSSLEEQARKESGL